jgi:signal transduction histidine kinase/ligand-binding sensor domain-containing protein
MKLMTVTGWLCALAVGALTVAAAPSPAAGQQRFRRWYDAQQGLPAAGVRALAQDGRGFLWIGTDAGLARYDGTRIQSIAPAELAPGVTNIAAAPTGVFVTDNRGRLFAARHGKVEAIDGPWGQAPARDIVVDPAGALWVASGASLWRRDRRGWRRVGHQIPDGDPIVRLVQADDRVGLLTRTAAWLLDGDVARRLGDVRGGVDLLVVDGRTLVATWTDRGRVVELTGGEPRELVSLAARPVALARRGRDVWASFDRYLARLRRGQPPELLGPEQLGPGGGGPLLVDHEGSLWVGNFLGLAQYPEPETVAFSDAHGLPSAHTRYLARADEGIWVATWQAGIGLIDADRSDARTIHEVTVRTAPCTAGDGSLWVVSGPPNAGIAVRRGAAFELDPARELRPSGGCVSAPDGSVWLSTNRGLWRAEPGAAPTRVAWLEVDGERRSADRIFVDTGERVWAATGDRVCSAPASALRSAGGSPWRCDRLPGIGHAKKFAETAAGQLWLATKQSGVWRRATGGWQPIPASTRTAGYQVRGLRPAPSGGMWALGTGGTVRVEPTDDRDGWRVIERLSQWHGLPSGGSDLIEDADGTLWVATSAGVVVIPPHARRGSHPPPPVFLVDTRANGEPVTGGAPLSLAHGDNRLSLSFAALSFRDRARLRYRYRLHAGDPWTPLDTPTLQLADLPAGRYEIELAASLDGERWATAPAPQSVTVAPPWYHDPWIWLAAIALVLAALFAVHRLRLAIALRNERQRLRIAMDLHDEMGSGLGSITLLAGLASDDGLPPSEHRDVADQIARTAGELGESLHDIVWSLRAGSDNLAALASWLSDRGSRMFPGARPKLVTRFPTPMPRLSLSLPVRRNLQLIALEAMHNAAKHAGADRVEVGLSPTSRGRWRLWVRDDGRGIDAPSPDGTGSGIGLDSMSRRAEEIDARFTIASNAGAGGTAIEIEFRPDAEDARTRSRGDVAARIHQRRKRAGGSPHESRRPTGDL